MTTWAEYKAQRDKYAKRYGLTTARKRKSLSRALLEKLKACKNESARRLLMGVSR